MPKPSLRAAAGEDLTQDVRRSDVKRVLVLGGELLRDRDELVGRVVRELDLPGEARAEPRVRLQEVVHQPRIARDDDDEAMAVVLHPLQQGLDRLRAEVEALVHGRERVGLVDEEDPVQRPPDHPVGLDRGHPDVLAHEPRPIGLDEVATAQQPHRAVHLREQPGDRGFSCAGVAEEDEVLRGRDLRQTVALTLRLYLEESHERPNLVLDGLEPGE